MSPHTYYNFSLRGELIRAFNIYIQESDLGSELYGFIGDWNVSSITDFSYLFLDRATFYDDIAS
jgi:hypothetical protein